MTMKDLKPLNTRRHKDDKAVPLPCSVCADEARATYSEGVLRLSLPHAS